MNKLEAIRERQANSSVVNLPRDKEQQIQVYRLALRSVRNDRAFLLRLVKYTQHKAPCILAAQPFQQHDCICGLSALLEETE